MGESSEFRVQSSEVRGQRSAVCGLRPEDRIQKPEWECGSGISLAFQSTGFSPPLPDRLLFRRAGLEVLEFDSDLAGGEGFSIYFEAVEVAWADAAGDDRAVGAEAAAVARAGERRLRAGRGDVHEAAGVGADDVERRHRVAAAHQVDRADRDIAHDRPSIRLVGQYLELVGPAVVRQCGERGYRDERRVA